MFTKINLAHDPILQSSLFEVACCLLFVGWSLLHVVGRMLLVGGCWLFLLVFGVDSGL